MTTYVQQLADRMMDLAMTERTAELYAIELSHENALLLPREATPEWAAAIGIDATHAYRGMLVWTSGAPVYRDLINLMPLRRLDEETHQATLYIGNLDNGEIFSDPENETTPATFYYDAQKDDLEW